jgi:hypothetical protein
MPPRITSSWWESVILFRMPSVARGRTVEVFRGQLCEAVHKALEEPDELRPQLYLVFTATQRKADWSAIQALSTKPDFPGLI